LELSRSREKSGHAGHDKRILYGKVAQSHPD
jgi:hypothetical protein